MKYFSIVDIIDGIEEEILYQANNYDEAMTTYEKTHNTTNASIMRFKLKQSDKRVILQADKTDDTPNETNLYKVRFKRSNIDKDRLIPDSIRDTYVEASSFEEAVQTLAIHKLKSSEYETISCFALAVQKTDDEA